MFSVRKLNIEQIEYLNSTAYYTLPLIFIPMLNNYDFTRLMSYIIYAIRIKRCKQDKKLIINEYSKQEVQNTSKRHLQMKMFI